MLNFTCPRCDVSLREEDCLTWDDPHDAAWDRLPLATVRFFCWACSWQHDWTVKVVAAEPAKLPA